MKFSTNSTKLQIKLLFATMLIAVLSFAFFLNASDNSYSNDTSSRVVVFEMQEFFDDVEPPLLQNDSLSSLTVSFSIALTAIISILASARSKIIPRLTFLYHIQPRSPPLQTSA